MSAGTDADDALARRIEEAGLNNLHTRRQLLYDGWILFLSPGKAKRARSVNAHFASSLPVAEKIARCEDVYARHGLATLFRVTPFSRPAGLERALAARRYVAFGETLVQHVAVNASPPVGSAGGVVVNPVPLEMFVDEVGAMRGSPAQQRAAHLERLAASPLELSPVIARHDEIVAGAGLLSCDGPLGGLFDIVVTDAMQGRGVGRSIVAALVARAVELGVGDLYLQVTADNAPAIALYRRFGFETRYRYRYGAREHELE